jgi:hypothetical protein
MAFYPHLTRLLRSGGVCCEISYGKPIRAADFPDWKSLARATEAAVRQLSAETKFGSCNLHRN